MKETPISGIEREFVLQAILQKRRLDGRAFKDRRNLRINFGKEWGSCYVSLGETKVLSQVTCEVQQPKATRPNEGLIYINVDISPMAAAHIEPGKPSDACVEINRVLEKCIKESKCVDLESLCIVADEKVWALRVDITVMNLEGNVAECASIAALAGLAHFKRPDVTSTGEGIIIHEASEKDPIPTTLHHFPVCLCYAIFHKGQHFVADPTEIEERIAEAHLSVGMNAYKELCGLHLKGKALTNHNTVIQCVKTAGVTAAEIVNSIKASLQEDEEARAKGENPGFASAIQKGKITSLCKERMQVRIKTQDLHEAAGRMLQKLHQNKRKIFDEDGNECEIVPNEQMVVPLGENSAELVSKDVTTSNSEDSIQGKGNLAVSTTKRSERQKRRKQKHAILSDGFDEKDPIESTEDLKNKSALKDAMINRPGQSQSSPITLSDTDEEYCNDGDLEVVQEVSKEEKEKIKLKTVENITLDDSEEEETSTLTHEDLEKPMPKLTPTFSGSSTESPKNKKLKKKKKSKADQPSRGWYPSKKW